MATNTDRTSTTTGVITAKKMSMTRTTGKAGLIPNMRKTMTRIMMKMNMTRTRSTTALIPGMKKRRTGMIVAAEGITAGGMTGTGEITTGVVEAMTRAVETMTRVVAGMSR